MRNKINSCFYCEYYEQISQSVCMLSIVKVTPLRKQQPPSMHPGNNLTNQAHFCLTHLKELKETTTCLNFKENIKKKIESFAVVHCKQTFGSLLLEFHTKKSISGFFASEFNV